MKLKFKITVLVIGFAFIQTMSFGQKSGGGYFYDTLTVMDYTTNLASERLSQLRKPLIRTFYLKNGGMSYTLFKGQVAKLTSEQVMNLLESGFSLYFDKMEYRDHKNLKPGVLELMAADGSASKTIENPGAAQSSAITNLLTKGAVIRLSDFIVSVNEKKLGPILMDIQIIEE